jgi:hypothetical protein
MTRIITTSIITLIIFGLLIWEHFHGGVPSHHILQQKDLPEISNWWGAVLIPILSWILIGRVETRIHKHGLIIQNQKTKIILLFLGGLFLGFVIVFSFTKNYRSILDNVPYIILFLSFLIPIYYSEFILGFILAMIYTFGAILPTIFILTFALLGYLIHRFIRPLIVSGKKKIFK